MTITNDIKYVGVFDSALDLFEGQYKIPEGISYNSYVIKDEKTAVMDSVDRAFGDEWLENIEKVLDGQAPNYLIVQHMEPDHSACIMKFKKKYPDAVLVSSKKAFDMMKNFFGGSPEAEGIVVKEGDELSLGAHTLAFIGAPMVHWPEVMLTYDKTEKILFSADAFGKFGGMEIGNAWDSEARRYYIGIVGKYGIQVQGLLKKAAGLEINKICPLHGPVLCKNLERYIALYDTWSSYKSEAVGVTVAYASVYGNTRHVAEMLTEKLMENGVSVKLHDLTRCDMSEAISDAFMYDKLVLASVTYNADIFPPMRAFIDGLRERGFQGKAVALIENGSWAPMAAKVMAGMLDGCKNLTFSENSVKILSAESEATVAQISALAEEFSK